MMKKHLSTWLAVAAWAFVLTSNIEAQERATAWHVNVKPAAEVSSYRAATTTVEKDGSVTVVLPCRSGANVRFGGPADMEKDKPVWKVEIFRDCTVNVRQYSPTLTRWEQVATASKPRPVTRTLGNHTVTIQPFVPPR